MKNIINSLSKSERYLWLASLGTVTLAFLCFGSGNVLSLTASLTGATALIFNAKGYVAGQVLTVIFSVFYGIISFYSKYYGEMITYLGMTAPIAVMSVISWARHRYKGSREVQVKHISIKQLAAMTVASAIVTAVFYFILKALNNANLFFSTVSVTTSFIASYLTLCRSEFYAVGYAANDIVLIILWILAACEDKAYIPMVICFIMFLANDIYGFYNWRKMKKRQTSNID